MDQEYLIPRGQKESLIIIKNSKFIGLAAAAFSVEEAKAFIKAQEQNYSDSSHVVYAYQIGFGSSVTHGMSDAGEPSGTAGRPILEVVKGSGIGDIVLVVVRYFGGTKLGTGGLVRAYTKSAQETLELLETIHKIPRKELVLKMGYEHFGLFENIAPDFDVEIVEKLFETGICLTISLPLKKADEFTNLLCEKSSGRIFISDSA